MARSQDIDNILRNWAYKPGTISARRVRAGSGREVLQMRVEMGILQMETRGRPDGQRPQGADTYLDWLIQRQAADGDEFELSEDDCVEMDREFLQFYHRRICWLALRDFGKAVSDADHTLALMDFASRFSPSEEWTTAHEQYRPFVLFHRTQAASLRALEDLGAERAIEEINLGLEQIRAVFQAQEFEHEYDEDEQVSQLVQLKQWLHDEYQVGPTLQERLAEAVKAEQYELAAELRDQIARGIAPKPRRKRSPES